MDLRRFGGVALHLLGRFDLIALKLYAFTDLGPTSKHGDDLRRLGPTSEELTKAARWCREQDTSAGFARELRAAVLHLGGPPDA